MSITLYYVCFAIVGYACGLFTTGYIIGKISGIDIRDYGSGNAGATNVLRVLGKLHSLLTFLGDALKGFIPVLVVKYAIGPSVAGMNVEFAALFIGLAVVLGHNYPFYLKFKGGKGIATTGGVMMAFDPKMGFCSLAIFIIVVAITRYVSLGSCLLSAALIIEMMLFHPGRPELLIMACIFAFFAIFRHRANIKRLLNGTESKIGQKVEVKK